MYRVRLTAFALLWAPIADIPLPAQQRAVAVTAARAALPTDAEILPIIKQRADGSQNVTAKKLPNGG